MLLQSLVQVARLVWDPQLITSSQTVLNLTHTAITIQANYLQSNMDVCILFLTESERQNKNFFVFLEDKFLFCLIFFSQVMCCGLEQSIQTEWIFWIKHFWFEGKILVNFLLFCHYSQGKKFARPWLISPKYITSKNWYNLFPVLYRKSSPASETFHNLRFDQQFRQMAKV